MPVGSRDADPLASPSNWCVHRALRPNSARTVRGSWRQRMALFLTVLSAAACTYGPEQERVRLGQIIRVGDSHQALAVTQYERFRPPTGVTAFPDGGKAQVLERRARLYLVNASERTASLLTEHVAPDSLWESFSLSVRGLVGDTVSYVALTGCPRNGQCHSELQNTVTLRVSLSGAAVRAVADVPAEARLPGVMLARREGEECYVRFSSEGATVTARFEEGASYQPILEVEPDGSLTPIDS